MLPAVFSQAELATAMPTSGGAYLYLQRAFGPLIGTIAGVGLWLSIVLKSAFALEGFGAYLEVLVDFPLLYAALFLLGAIIVLNVLGARKVGRIQVAIVSVTIVGLLLILIGGLFEYDPELYAAHAPADMDGIFAAAAFVFVSFAGVTKVAAIAEEVDNPGRNLPVGMMCSLAIVTLLYVLVTRILPGNVPVPELVNDFHPLYSLGMAVGGSLAGGIAACLAILTMTSMANSGLLAASRFPLAMSRDNLIPQAFRKIHQTRLTPMFSILITGLTMAVIIIALNPVSIAKLASAFILMTFIAVNITVVVLRETGVQWYKPSYLSPLYPWMQIFGTVTGFVLLYMLGNASLLAAVAVLVLGSFVFYFYGRKHAEQQGVVKLYGHRAILSLISGRYRNQKQERFEQRVKEKRKHLVAGLYDTLSDDGHSQQEAAVVVPLFGLDRSPEMLVEIGASLANGNKVQAVHITEIPDQTLLDAMLNDDPVVNSLERRFEAMSGEKELQLEFDAVVTHDVVRTVRSISEKLHCRWLIMSWNGRSGEGLFVRNPVGWLMHHLPCNVALFKDSGVRYIREILVVTSATTDVEILIDTAAHLAHVNDGKITLVDVIDPDASEDELKVARQKLDSLKMKLNLHVKCIVLKSRDRHAAILEITPGYDLLITGAPKETGFIRGVFGLSRDKITAGAACSVLRLSRPKVSVSRSSKFTIKAAAGER